MCGIAGLLDASQATSGEELAAIAAKMADTLRHRGPDGGGTWADGGFGVALGFRRLAILDLSATGAQPMRGATGRHVVAFNGEIYNFRALRSDLEARGHAFRGTSDTEVLLAAMLEWGVSGALQRCNGMFALAVWDRDLATLHLARDRMGEKPLYYGWAGKSLLFASELKAIVAHPNFRPEVDRNALALLLRHKYVPGPHCIYQGVHKLAAGHILSVGVPAAPGGAGCPKPYWSARLVAEQAAASPFAGSLDDAVDELGRLLSDAVGLRMVADVPLGAFLSGGIDSSTVVALMQAQSSRPIRTFTIGNPKPAWDESSQARAVAAWLGTEHTELQVTATDALQVVPSLAEIYDEPFSDSSQVPTMLVSRMARRDITVSLSGDGGDELFGGYNRYLWGRAAWLGVRHSPRPVRRGAAAALTSLSPARWDNLWQRCSAVLPARLQQRMPGEKLHKLARVLGADSPEDTYRIIVSHWLDPASVVLAASEPATLLTQPGEWPVLGDRRSTEMWLDAVTYLCDDILVKLDRASMAASLEARVPMLDHRVVELAWSLPPSMKIAGGTTKLVLRRLLDRHVPAALVDRPKMGFGVPMGEWLRGPLRSWGEALLDERRLLDEGFFDPVPIRRRWAAHQAGRGNWSYELWDVLMFQTWLERASRS